MLPNLDHFPLPYIDAQTLLQVFKNYTNPRDCISRMIKKGLLIRLKNGFYIIASKIKERDSLPLEQIANMLYGPSYISLEWALSFYSFIPERVTLVTSVTCGKTKTFNTPIGDFSYTHLSLSKYDIAIDRRSMDDWVGGFLIATPEKALIDYIFLRWKKFDVLSNFLESTRIEFSTLQQLDKKFLKEINKIYRSSEVDKFIGCL